MWHAVILGVRLAALHLGVGVVVSALLMEMLFVRIPLVPFVSPYVPSGEIAPRGVAFVAAVLCVSFTLAWGERFALRATAGYLTFIAIMVGLSAAAVIVDRASHRASTPLDLDEATPASSHQHLDLQR
jgi:hypothetical protein